MRQRIETYIKKYLNCQQNKHVTHAKYDKIQYMKSSKLFWDEVFMNVTNTLRRDEKYNSTTYLRYQASARGAQRIEQIEQVNA